MSKYNPGDTFTSRDISNETDEPALRVSRYLQYLHLADYDKNTRKWTKK